MVIDEEYMKWAQEHYKVFCPKCGQRTKMEAKENDGCVPSRFLCAGCNLVVAPSNLTADNFWSYLVYKVGEKKKRNRKHYAIFNPVAAGLNPDLRLQRKGQTLEPLSDKVIVGVTTKWRDITSPYKLVEITKDEFETFDNWAEDFTNEVVRRYKEAK